MSAQDRYERALLFGYGSTELSRPYTLEYSEDDYANGSVVDGNKRDKRRQNLAARLANISDMFTSERDAHYREMLRTLQTTLASLHAGDNQEFLEDLADMEESRDRELAKLALWEQYQIEKSDRQLQEDIETAEREYSQTMDLVKERLMARLEAQRKKLKEDKALLDIANDHSVFLQTNTNSVPNGNSNGAAVPGSPGAGGGSGSLYTDRRSTRRRQELISASMNEDLSGLSGTETRSGAGGTGSRRRGPGGGNRTGASDAEAFNERDMLEGVLFAKERDVPNTRHTSRSYSGVPGLKPEEANEDLAILRGAMKRKR
uniref:ARAD1D28204p n=1 Tax=Blastobotrys adeninivorans TaxID=409370 RepID=A0A060TH54_BLAAD